MVALNPRFALLVIFCSLAAMSLTANAAVIDPRNAGVSDLVRMSKKGPLTPTSRVLGRSFTPNVKQQKRIADWSTVGQLAQRIVDSRRKDGHFDEAPYHNQQYFDHHDYDTHAHVSHRDRFYHSKNAHTLIGRSLVFASGSKRRSMSVTGSPSHRFSERGDPEQVVMKEQEAVAGTIAVVINGDDSATVHKVAYLFMDNSNPENRAITASTTNQTVFYIVDAPASTTSLDSSSGTYTRIQLKPSSSSVSTNALCATFDPDSENSEPILMTECFDSASLETHQSQAFLYHQATHELRPVRTVAKDDVSPKPVRSPESGNPSVIGARNVTLLFEPSSENAVGVKNVAQPPDTLEATTTSTVIVTVTSTSALTPTSTSISAADAMITSAASPPSTSTSGVASNSSAGLLDVSSTELASSLLASSTASSSVSTSAPVNAEAVASSIAASRVSSLSSSTVVITPAAASSVISSTISVTPSTTAVAAVASDAEAPSSSDAKATSTFLVSASSVTASTISASVAALSLETSSPSTANSVPTASAPTSITAIPTSSASAAALDATISGVSEVEPVSSSSTPTSTPAPSASAAALDADASSSSVVDVESSPLPSAPTPTTTTSASVGALSAETSTFSVTGTASPTGNAPLATESAVAPLGVSSYQGIFRAERRL